MERRTSHFEDHLSVVEAGHEKTASKLSAKGQNTTLLAKLAAELGLEGNPPVAEGQKELPGREPSEASTEVAAAMDGVANPQLVAAGTDVAAQAIGMEPKVVGETDPVLIATGEGEVTDAENLNRTEEAVAAAGRGAGGAQEGKLETAAVNAPEKAEAEKVGQLIARSFQATLEKDAADIEYTEALNFLADRGMLDNYTIRDPGLEKVASEEVDALEKIASGQPLTRDDVIAAAAQYIEVEKIAEEADAQGRAEAHELVEQVAEEEKLAELENEEQEKIAELMQDENVVAAVKVLKQYNLL